MTMRITRRRGIVAAIVLAVVAIVAFLLRPKPVEVQVARASLQPLRVAVEAEGRTRVRQRYVITAPITGRLQRLSLVEGNGVGAGDVVAVIAPPPLDGALREQASSRLDAAIAQQGEAGSRLHQARLALADAERSSRRMRTLAEAGAVPLRDRERAELALGASRDDLAAAEARVRAAAAEVRVARSAIAGALGDPRAFTRVPSPVSGRVLHIPEASERLVAAGTPILEIGDPSSLEVVADFLSADAVRIRPGASVELRGSGDSSFTGRVRSVTPSAFTRVSALGVDEQRVDVVIDPAGTLAHLGDGFRLTASVTVWQGERVLVVPASALVRDGNEWIVYLVDDGRARRRVVAVGQQGSALVQLTGGIREGDEVILFPSDRISDGARVKVE